MGKVPLTLFVGTGNFPLLICQELAATRQLTFGTKKSLVLPGRGSFPLIFHSTRFMSLALLFNM